jgi:hypothetical protein
MSADVIDDTAKLLTLVKIPRRGKQLCVKEGDDLSALGARSEASACRHCESLEWILT